MMIIVVHGHSQKLNRYKGLDLLTKDLRDQGYHVHEYQWNGNLKQAAFNIKQHMDGHKLIGIAYSWGNPWLKWLADDFNINFLQIHHIAPVNRQKGFPYSLRQVRALLRIGDFKTAKNAQKVYAYRQVNDRPAEKRVKGHNVASPQIVLGTEKRIKKYAGKTWRFGKVTAHEAWIQASAKHGNMDDNRMIHRRIMERIKYDEVH